MKHLYIIGNGFDIFTGLKTRYVDFRWWLENNYPFIYENMQAAYDIEGEWWSDFEVQLGQLNVKEYVKKFAPTEKSISEVLEEIEKRKAFIKKYSLSPDFRNDSPCAKRLKGLLDVLQYCFEKWVDSCQRMIVDAQYVNIEKEDSYFINFNYTDVLQCLYGIPEERVWHIHGRALKRERLIFGHNRILLGSHSDDEEQTRLVLGRYHKNPYEHILGNNVLRDILKSVEYVHIYGLSFSPVDEGYIDWIFQQTSVNVQWEVSWKSEFDRQRIDEFVQNHWDVKSRLKLIELKDMAISCRSVYDDDDSLPG